MNETIGPSWLQTIFSLKSYKSTGCFNVKFPGLALAWLTITASTLVRIIFLPPLIHNAADITLYILSFAMGLYGAATNKLVILGLMLILWSFLLSHWALIIMVLTNTDKHQHFSIALSVTIAGALGLYYFIAAISYQILSIKTHPEANEPIATASTEAPTTTDAQISTPRRSRPSVPHLPSIIERSFTVAPSGDASSAPPREQKPSDHRFVGGPMPIISY